MLWIGPDISTLALDVERAVAAGVGDRGDAAGAADRLEAVADDGEAVDLADAVTRDLDADESVAVEVEQAVAHLPWTVLHQPERGSQVLLGQLVGVLGQRGGLGDEVAEQAEVGGEAVLVLGQAGAVLHQERDGAARAAGQAAVRGQPGGHAGYTRRPSSKDMSSSKSALILNTGG